MLERSGGAKENGKKDGRNAIGNRKGNVKKGWRKIGGGEREREREREREGGREKENGARRGEQEAGGK